MLDRADELVVDLEGEYKKCLQLQSVNERAKNLTHEVLEKLRHSLDHAMYIVWEKHVAPTLSEEDKSRARVYFPITNKLSGFRSLLGRGKMSDLEKAHNNIYGFLLSKQPFSSAENRWLVILSENAALGKHVHLTPQKRTETRRIKVSREGGSVSWDPSSVKFGGEVSVMGAPIDSNTQRIIPTPGVTEQVEIWVSFILDSYGVNALAFCKEACQKTRALMEEMIDVCI
jgi:hypothetical protein